MSRFTPAWRIVATCAVRDTMFFIPVAIVWYASRGADLAGFLAIQAIFRLSTVVLEVPTGILSDRWDRKRVLVVSSALWVASMALLAAATDFGGLLAAELVAAASCSLQSGTVESLLHETVREDPRVSSASWQSRLFALSLAGQTAASLLGGCLYEMSPDLPVQATLVGSVAAFALTLTLRPVPRAVAAARPAVIAGIGELATRLRSGGSRIAALLFAPPVAFSMTGILFWAGQTRFAETGLTQGGIGVALAVYCLAKVPLSLASSRLRRAMGDRRTVLVLLAMLAAGDLGMALGGSPGVVWASFLLGAGAVHAVGKPLVTDILCREARDTERATLLSLSSMVEATVGGLSMLAAAPVRGGVRAPVRPSRPVLAGGRVPGGGLPAQVAPARRRIPLIRRPRAVSCPDRRSSRTRIPTMAQPSPDPVYVQGHFADRVAAGDRPDCSLPPSSLPAVRPGANMVIETCFLAAGRDR